jgi:ERF superfamily
MLAEIQAKLKAPKSKHNTFGDYAYRNADIILRAFKEIAPTGASLVMTDEVKEVAGRIFLTCTVQLCHDGKVVAEAKGAAMHALQKKGMDDAQITGACSSYARKYALCGLFAIDDSADDPDAKDNRRATEDAAELAHERAVGDAQAMLESADSLPDLATVWKALKRDVQADPRVIEAKDKRKSELTQKEAA